MGEERSETGFFRLLCRNCTVDPASFSLRLMAAVPVTRWDLPMSLRLAWGSPQASLDIWMLASFLPQTTIPMKIFLSYPPS